MKRAIGFLILFLAPLSLVVWGGGFWIEAAEPASSAPQGTVAEVYPLGCHRPTEATFQASAEGVIDGIRQSIPLQQVRSLAGALVIQRQWPGEGRWVLAISATYRGRTRSLLIEIDPATSLPILKESDSRMLSRSPTEKDILAALKSMSRGGV